jgi:multidrug resistance efflux pump
MDKDKLPPIPTPASQRWREFRIQVLPFAVFILILCAIVYLWRSYVRPVGIVGFAETNMVNVTSLSDGMLTDLFVERWQNINAGQEIAVVVNTDPDVLKAQLTVARTELNLMRARLRADVDRIAQGYQQIKIDISKERVEKEIASINLIYASSNFVRVAELFQSKNASAADYDAAKAQKDALEAEVRERAKFITELEVSLFTATNGVSIAGNELVDAAIDAKGAEIELMLKPTTLKAPISGMVSHVFHVKGERILRGMPIVAISDPETKKIIGYLRQPVVREPKTNDVVEITTSSHPRRVGQGRVLNVGAQLEPINPALLAADVRRMEVGLPVLISVPPGLRLLPGEYVNLTIQPSR